MEVLVVWKLQNEGDENLSLLQEMVLVTVIFEDCWLTEIEAFFNIQYDLLLLIRMQLVNILRKVYICVCSQLVIHRAEIPL